MSFHTPLLLVVAALALGSMPAHAAEFDVAYLPGVQISFGGFSCQGEKGQRKIQFKRQSATRMRLYVDRGAGSSPTVEYNLAATGYTLQLGADQNTVDLVSDSGERGTLGTIFASQDKVESHCDLVAGGIFDSAWSNLYVALTPGSRMHAVTILEKDCQPYAYGLSTYWTRIAYADDVQIRLAGGLSLKPRREDGEGFRFFKGGRLACYASLVSLATESVFDLTVSR